MRVVSVKMEQDKKSPEGLNCQAGFVNKGGDSYLYGSDKARGKAEQQGETASMKSLLRNSSGLPE
jgi:hypothetical protein